MALDRVPHRWTDDCPIPLLGWAMGCIVVGVFSLSAAVMAQLVFFTRVLHGPAAITLTILAAAFWISGGWLCYRRRMIGWWLTIVPTAVWILSITVWSAVGDPNQVFNADFRTANRFATSPGFLRASMAGGAACYVAGLAYGIFVRRFVRPSRVFSDATEASSPATA